MQEYPIEQKFYKKVSLSDSLERYLTKNKEKKHKKANDIAECNNSGCCFFDTFSHGWRSAEPFHNAGSDL